MKSRVLITGVAGFIGSNLANRLLNKGCTVVGIDNLSYGVREQIPGGTEFHEIDIRDKHIHEVFGGVDYVYHLAAKNCISDCQEDPLETSDINVTGTVNVFEAARRAKVRKVIYAESSALYEGISVFPTPEHEVRPLSVYASSKYAAMLFAENYRRFFGLPMTALRYFCVYGPRQDYRRSIPPVFSAFIIKLLKGEQPVIYGDGNKRRDFVHVDDVNDFHLLCMTDDRSTGGVYNLGSGISYSINEIYEVIASLLVSNTKPVYKADLPGEAETTLADIGEAKKLGWIPKITLQAGLLTSVEFIRKEIEKGRI